jgi:glucose-1-phosphate cytidylyltransferase
LNLGGGKIELHSSDVSNWRITFVDTGLHSNIGQRLMRARKYVENEEMFLANYSDGLAALPLDRQIAEFEASGAIASLASVYTSGSFHTVKSEPGGLVSSLGALSEEELYINGGFFVLRRQIFDYMQDGDELVERPFERLIAEKKLMTFRWKGFWQCMDTFKDKITLDRMEARGQCPWMLWK